MNKNLKVILYSLFIAIFTLFIFNLLSFGFELLQSGIGESWSFRFKHGVFYSGDKPTGLIFGTPIAGGFILLVFLINIFRYYRKGELSIS